VRLFGVSWADYQVLREIRRERRRPKIAYFKGTLELVSTSRRHERVKSWLGRLVEAWCLEQGVELSAYGEWTLEARGEEVAGEPDECYVVGEEPEDKERPDLVIEVVLTSGGLNKLDIYHALRIREVWFCVKDRIQIFAWRPRGYEPVDASELLDGLDLTELLSFVDRPAMTQAVRDYQEALRKRRRRSKKK
jgi:Uma2 family endonuclease